LNTKVLRMAPRESAQEQARRWIARIDAGELDAQSRVELRAWLAEDPRHASLLDTHALLWSAASRADFPARSRPQSAPAQALLSRPHRLAGALASFASVAAVAGALWAYLGPESEPQPQPHQVTISTAPGQHELVTLRDGSRIHLNTASAARVEYGGRQRRVRLERGEGFFDVAKDAVRPFEVVAGSSIVRAIGTRFTVQRLDDRRLEVTVFEGIVEVLRAPESSGPKAEVMSVLRQPLRLAAGQQAFDAGDQIVLRALSPSALNQRLAWQEGRIVFDATPLSVAVEQVNRYADRPIRLVDTALQAVKVSGSFSTREIPVFLDSLEQGFGLHVEQRADAVLISAVSRR
jgi:transmembrane sensor